MNRIPKLSILFLLALYFGCNEEPTKSSALYECVQEQLSKEEHLTIIQKLLLYDFVINGHENTSFEELSDRFCSQLITKISGHPVEVTSSFKNGCLSLKQITKHINGTHKVSNHELSEEGLSYFRAILIPCSSENK